VPNHQTEKNIAERCGLSEQMLFRQVDCVRGILKSEDFVDVANTSRCYPIDSGEILESSKGPVEMLVVDSAQKPTEN